jgi:hypothetical protein
MSLQVNPQKPKSNTIPNGSFSYPETWQLKAPTGYFLLGNGLTITANGEIVAASEAGGTVRKVSLGPGLSGGTIETEGEIRLAPPADGQIGGVKAGANVTIDNDGTISVAPPGIGTVTGVSAGSGLSATGTNSVTVSLNTATDSQIGGLVLGQTLTAVGATVDVVPSSETQAGVVAIASSVDVAAGVDNTKAITAAGLASKLATTTSPGLVQLAGPLSNDPAKAATAATVFTVGEMANAAVVTAASCLSLSGGTLTGPVTFAQGQQFPAFALPIATTTSLGVVQIGAGLNVDINGTLSAANKGTVTSLVMGDGIGAPFSGDTITSTGTIRLLPPTNGKIGGVKPGSGVSIANDGTLSLNGVVNLNNSVAYNSYIFPASGPNAQAPGENGTVLTLLDKSSGQVGWTASGGVGLINSGVGLTGGPITTSGTLSLANTTVTPGTYGATGIIPTFTVDQQGRITSSGSTNPYNPYLFAESKGQPIVQLDFSANTTNWDFTLETNTTLANPQQAQSGQTGCILIRQNAITPYSLTFDSAWKFSEGVKPSISPEAGAVDFLAFTVVSPTYIVVTNYLSKLG